MSNYVISISREFGSGGRLIGKRLAAQLGIPCYDRTIIQKTAEKSGLSPDFIARAEERARRRMLELEERGTPEPYAAILRAIQERDWNDTHRDAAPLRQAEDAVLLDTTALDFVQSEDALLHIIRERTGL